MNQRGVDGPADRDDVRWPFHLVERSRLVDDVTGQLREMILGDFLLPGTKLLQVQLAEALGVSRTPLREAFRILEREGLVRISNGNRTVEVVSFTRSELRELYELREVIDGLAARLAARRGLTPAEDRTIRGLLDDMEAASCPYDQERHVPAHMAFHVAILECCGNRRVAAEIALVRRTASALYSAAALRETGPAADAMFRRACEQHRAIYKAIADRDERSAESEARRHIAGVLRSSLIEQSAADV